MRSTRIGVGGVFSPTLSRSFVVALATVCLPTMVIVGSACSDSTSGTTASVPQKQTAAADELTALRQKAAAGDAHGQNRLGLAYLTGFYISEDLKSSQLTKDEALAAQ